VLFEMLTGKRAFPGEDITDTIVSVVSKEPDFNALPAPTPVGLRKLLTGCLKKDARARMQAIGDARVQVEELLSGATDEMSRSASISVALPALPRSRALTWTLATSTLGLAIVLVLSAPWRVEAPVDRPLVRLDVDLGPNVSLPALSDPGSPVALSPDGTRLVYASGTPTKLFIWRLDQPDATELPGTQGAARPFFSPDGQWVGFLASGKVNKVAVNGGAVVPLMDIGGSFAGANWGENGRIVVSDAFGKGLLRIPADGGLPETVAALGTGEQGLVLPQMLPGDNAILFAAFSTGGDVDKSTIEVLTLADRRRKIVVRGGTSPRYLTTSTGAGHVVYVNHATLFAVPFDLATLETRGTAVPVLDDVAYAASVGTGQFDVSGTGTLVYRRASAEGTRSVTVAWLDASGKTQPLLAKPGVYGRPSLSPDGHRLALEVREGLRTDIWVYDWPRDTMTRVTFNGNAESPVWSLDGRFMVFSAGGAGLSVTRSDGAGQPQSLTQSKNQQLPFSFTPDGKRLAFEEQVGTRSDVWTVPLGGDGTGLRAGKPEAFLQTPADERYPAFSPDGRWLAYASDESGTFQTYVRAFPDAGGKWQISNSGGTYPMWSRSGRELFFETLDNHIFAVGYTVKGDAFVADKPRVWSETPIAGVVNTAKSVDLAPDGKRIVALMQATTGDAQQQVKNHVVFLLNFFDELRRRAPGGK
jgi:Tol biopolymer transport system component